MLLPILPKIAPQLGLFPFLVLLLPLLYQFLLENILINLLLLNPCLEISFDPRQPLSGGGQAAACVSRSRRHPGRLPAPTEDNITEQMWDSATEILK